MDPIEEKRRQLEEEAAKRRLAQADEKAALQQSIASDVSADPPQEDLETARLRLEVERTRLELERDKLLFERQKLEAERKRAAGGRPSERTRASRPPGGEQAPAGDGGKSPGAPQRPSPAPVIVLLLAVAAATGTGFGVVYVQRGSADTGTTVPASETPELAALRAKADADRARELEQSQQASLEAQRERDQVQAEADRREAEERRQQAEVARAAAELREEQEREEKRLAGLVAEALAIKSQFYRPMLPAVLRGGLERLEALAADPAGDADVLRVVQQAREQADVYRPLAIDQGVSEARRLADARRYADALAMLADVEAIQGVLSEAVKEERTRWIAAEVEAQALAAKVAALAAPPEGEEATAEGPTGAFSSRARENIVAAVRANPDTELAVQKALSWLARHQSADGRWDSDRWAATCKGVPCAGPGANAGDGRYDVGNTALALLAFLGNGHTHRFGAFKQTVLKGLQFLARQQAADGSVGFDASNGEAIYNHAIATMALCEGYALAGDETLQPFAALAVKFCLDAQNPGMGWKYGIRSQRNDTSVTGWMVLALKAGKAAGLEVPDAAFAGARAWFMRATDSEGNTGYETPGGGSSYLHQNDGKYDLTQCMTAVSVMCRVFMGERPADAPIVKGAKLLGDNPPAWAEARNTRKVNMYYWYYGTYAMFQVGGNGWAGWNRAIQASLLPNQRVGGCVDGAWDPVCEWALAGGRVYSTAISALTLEVYYRYGRAGVAPAAAAGPGAPAAARAPALAKVEADVRRRFASWIRVRGPSAMSCPRCRGTERVRCSDCGGDGVNEVQRVDGLHREPCPSCTNGTGPCKDGQCLGGLDKQSLRTAFWDCRSAEAKRGTTWEVVREQLQRGELRDLVGSALIVTSAEVSSVEVLDDRARVTATVAWGADGGAREEWTSTWVRYSGRYYLATGSDLAPDRLR